MMGSIIIGLPKQEDAKNISDILIRRGFTVNAVCTTGSGILSAVNTLGGGVVICTKRFSDMYYSQLNEYLPKQFKMILMASPNVLEMCTPDIERIELPFKPSELCQKVEEVLYNQTKQQKKLKSVPKKRTEAENICINDAKQLLMDSRQMTEQEAFRYIQKCSMDSGTNMVEMAQMIVSIGYENYSRRV